MLPASVPPRPQSGAMANGSGRIRGSSRSGDTNILRQTVRRDLQTRVRRGDSAARQQRSRLWASRRYGTELGAAGYGRCRTVIYRLGVKRSRVQRGVPSGTVKLIYQAAVASRPARAEECTRIPLTPLGGSRSAREMCAEITPTCCSRDILRLWTNVVR